MNNTPIWSPSPERINNSNIIKFIDFINNKFDIKISNYKELYDWSVVYIANFWEAISEFMNVIYSKKADNIILQKFTSHIYDIRNFKWFAGAKLNFSQNLLKFRDDETAIIYSNENSKLKYISFKQLYSQTAKFHHFLKSNSIALNDRIAGYISNNTEAVVSMLATSSIGAIWTSTSPDFGFQGVFDRFSQVEPKILIAVDGYNYNGKIYNNIDKINQLVDSISSIEKVIIINQIDAQLPQDKRFIRWEDALDNDNEEIEFVQLDFDHPLYIMYSSGTTGVPKCIVHGQGGTLLQHFKELVLHTNLTDLDTISYFTTCGWMMWNWLISSLAVGATIVLIDGSPIYPNINRLWQLIDDAEITIFGTSPKFLSLNRNEIIEPINSFSLISLKTILSTGSPLSVEDFNWVYSKVKKEVQLSSISGGTDILSCFMLGCPILPVYAGEIQCRGLGMKVESFDEDGVSIINQKGELVCTAPFPSMPLNFWNDFDGKKYNNSYFNVFPGVWRHGDYIKITDNGAVIVYGRSDTTLNPGGVRIGTAEIYQVVENIEVVKDSIIIGYPNENDIDIVLFIVLKDNYILNQDLKSIIINNIKNNLTNRHLPKYIFQVDDIPHTLNGKKVEMAVLKTLLGEEVKNKSALANPESLLSFNKFIEILKK